MSENKSSLGYLDSCHAHICYNHSKNLLQNQRASDLVAWYKAFGSFVKMVATI